MKNEVLVTQSCLTLCNPMGYSPLGSSVHGFSRQEYWSGLPYPSPRDLPYPGIEPRSPALQADSLPSETPVGKIILFNTKEIAIEATVNWTWDMISSVT